jgi:hypothetical protein
VRPSPLNGGFIISINNVDETIVNQSRNSGEIINATFHTEMDTITLNVEERRVAFFTLIYDSDGSGVDVISDHTDLPHISRLVEHTMKEFERPS